jgi:hypothetical protein
LCAARGFGLARDGFGRGEAGLGDAFGIGGGQGDHAGRLAFAQDAHALAFRLGQRAGLLGLLRRLAQRRLAFSRTMIDSSDWVIAVCWLARASASRRAFSPSAAMRCFS